MPSNLYQLLSQAASKFPANDALFHRDQRLTYQQLKSEIDRFSDFLAATCQPGKHERVAIYLPKEAKAVVSIFASSRRGAVFVPLNPLLKPPQVSYIVADCAASILITSKNRWRQLERQLGRAALPSFVILTDATDKEIDPDNGVYGWPEFGWPELEATSQEEFVEQRQASDLGSDIASDIAPDMASDMAAILYTSGSTGQPKGVILSHHNLIVGASSVASYLQNTAADRLLAVLPFSFDYGLSQLTTAFLVGASVVLMEYLLPRDVVKAVVRYQITGLAAVPPLWHQLSELDWPQEAVQSLRYWTNSGGHMPPTLLANLQQCLPQSTPFLMYGLTEAFRSSYLPPEQLSKRPESIGKAIPNAELLVLNENGEQCAAKEVGELVHRGPLVAMGYWNAAEKTAERFKPLPSQIAGDEQEIAVYSGDYVWRDDEDFLYFVGRRDEMIKCSGYRVSPGEVESSLLVQQGINDVVAMGVPHPQLGQAIVVVCASNEEPEQLKNNLSQWCRSNMPGYMQPRHLEIMAALPRNNNGKIDRSALKQQFEHLFDEN